MPCAKNKNQDKNPVCPNYCKTSVETVEDFGNISSYRLHAISKPEKYNDSLHELRSQKVIFNSLSPNMKISILLNVDGGSEAVNSALLNNKREIHGKRREWPL